MALPAAQPAYILRGHDSQIYATAFIRSNSRLVSGDADGWIVVWSLAIKRPVAVWRAHEGSILGARAWGADKLITHGKDNKLIVWKFSEEDEAFLSSVLPVDTHPEPRKQPWLLHVLHVNTMNFCSFAHLPNTMSSETVEIFHLPSQQRIHTLPNPGSFKGGMIMALSIFHHPLTNHLIVISAYESGHTSVSQLTSSWHALYISQPHTQPILSLDISPSKDYYLSSSADAIIAKHPIPPTVIGSIENMPLKTLQTKHAGQQSLQIRNDGKIFATAGWDSRVRVYSCKGLKELAVLKWHKEGCYSAAFAEVVVDEEKVDDGEGEGKGKEIVKSGKGMSIREERVWKATNVHWLVAGSKDGKVSLWDIY